jgi:hypothetical protein
MHYQPGCHLILQLRVGDLCALPAGMEEEQDASGERHADNRDTTAQSMVLE